MKKLINIVMTIIIIVILKGCIIAPIYLCFAPFVTAYRWGCTLHAIRMSIPFEVRCVWYTLRNDWRDGCEGIIYNLKQSAYE